MAPGEDMDHTFTYFCVAEGNDDRWEAICLNLDIAVEGNTLADVKARMHECVKSYVLEALQMPEPDQNRLLDRSVPLRLKLKYAFKLLRHSLKSARRDGGLQESFEIPCHA